MWTAIIVIGGVVWLGLGVWGTYRFFKMDC